MLSPRAAGGGVQNVSPTSSGKWGLQAEICREGVGYQDITIRSGFGDVRQIRNIKHVFCWRLSYISHKSDDCNSTVFIRDCSHLSEVFAGDSSLPHTLR